MKKLFKILSMGLVAVMLLPVLALTACGSTNGAKEGELSIMYYDGAFGKEWLENALNNFVAKKATENVTVTYKLTPETQIKQTATNHLKSSKNLEDIYFMQEAVWTDWVVRGYLEPLTDVYEAEVQTSSGKRKVKDYMVDDYERQYYMQRVYGQGDNVPWALPWSMSQLGFVYNEGILLETEHTTAKAGAWAVGDKWTAPPETLDDFLAYCADVKARDIAPIIFCGAASNFLRFVVQLYWAQYQGVYTKNALTNIPADQGTYYDYWNFESLDVFKQDGLKKGLEVLQQILTDGNGNWANTVDNVDTYTLQDAERRFVQGDAAMLIGASFMYSEVEDYLTDDIVFKMMNTPVMENAQCGTDGKPLNINYYSAEDFIMVPAKATNKELAKEFLVYLSSEECLVDFTKITGTMRPFEYKPDDILGETYEFNSFTQSVIDVFNKSDVHLVSLPAATDPKDRTLMSVYHKLNLNGSVVWATFAKELRSKTPAQLMENVYNTTKPNWDKWVVELGM